MSCYIPKKKTDKGIEDVKFPINSIKGLEAIYPWGKEAGDADHKACQCPGQRQHDDHRPKQPTEVLRRDNRRIFAGG